MTILRLDSVSKTHSPGAHPVAALRDITLTVDPGEMVAVMGASGSGKSTLLSLAGGLDDPTSGDVFVGGSLMSRLKASERARLRRTTVGYVFQDYNLIPTLTAGENVAMPLDLDGVSGRTSRKAARAALAEIGLAGVADRFPMNCPAGNDSVWPSPAPSSVSGS